MKVLPINPIFVGITCALISYLSYAISDAMKKYLAADYSIYDIQVWNSFFSLAVILIFGLVKGETKRIITTTQPKLHTLRVILLIPIMFGITYILRYMPLVNFYAVVFTTPFITAILAHLFFNEKLTPKRIGFICLGFAGVLIAYPPTIETITVPLLMTLGVAFCIACLMLSFKVAGKGEHKLTYAFYPNVVALVIAIVLASDQVLNFVPFDYLLSAAIGVCVVIGLVYSAKAYQAAPAAVVSIVHYSQIFYGVILGYFFFGDIPTVNMVIGVTVILIAGASMALSERRKKAF